MDITLKKVDKQASFWPQLLDKHDSKPHWLKVDFDRWKDSESEHSEAGGNEYDELIKQYKDRLTSPQQAMAMGGCYACWVRVHSV